MPPRHDKSLATQIAKTLKVRRAELGLTQAEAAARVGTSRRTYEAWEAARRVPREFGRIQIARAFKLSYTQLGMPELTDGLRNEIDALRRDLERVLKALHLGGTPPEDVPPLDQIAAEAEADVSPLGGPRRSSEEPR